MIDYHWSYSNRLIRTHIHGLCLGRLPIVKSGARHIWVVWVHLIKGSRSVISEKFNFFSKTEFFSEIIFFPKIGFFWKLIFFQTWIFFVKNWFFKLFFLNYNYRLCFLQILEPGTPGWVSPDPTVVVYCHGGPGMPPLTFPRLWNFKNFRILKYGIKRVNWLV